MVVKWLEKLTEMNLELKYNEPVFCRLVQYLAKVYLTKAYLLFTSSQLTRFHHASTKAARLF